jgi:UDP-glucose 4-epimerase
MKILITGGAGFIGSHLCDELILKNYSVTVIDNLILGSLNNIKHLLDNPNFNFYEEDILKLSSLELIFKNHNFDMVYHLAANSDIQKGSNDPDVDYSLTF